MKLEGCCIMAAVKGIEDMMVNKGGNKEEDNSVSGSVHDV